MPWSRHSKSSICRGEAGTGVCTDRVAVTIRIHGMEADIHSGADAAL